MATHAVAWLARKELLSRTVTIKVRYSDFTTITRSHTAAPSRAEQDFVGRAVQLLDKTDAGRRPVRLLGVSVHNLCTQETILGGFLLSRKHHTVKRLRSLRSQLNHFLPAPKI